MTIDVKVETAWSAKAGGFRYVRSDNVAVVSVTGERDASSTPLRSVLRACAARFEQFLHDWLRALPLDRIVLFTATSFSDQHNALTRRRGIWGSNELLWLPGGDPRSLNVEIDGPEGGVRFAGLAEVREAQFFEAADFVRTHAGSFLCLSPREDLSDARVRSMVKKAFPRGESAVNWAAAVEQVEAGEDVCIRAGGAFDDRHASIDVFLRADLLRRIGAP